MTEKNQNPAADPSEIENAVAGALAAAEAANKNPFFDLFDAPHFTPIENATIYTNRDGSKVVALASVSLPLKRSNTVIPGKIEMRRFPGKKGGAVAVCKLPGLKPLDDSANADLTEFRKRIATQYTDQQTGPAIVGSAAGVSMDASGINWGDDE